MGDTGTSAAELKQENVLSSPLLCDCAKSTDLEINEDNTSDTLERLLGKQLRSLETRKVHRTCDVFPQKEKDNTDNGEEEDRWVVGLYFVKDIYFSCAYLEEVEKSLNNVESSRGQEKARENSLGEEEEKEHEFLHQLVNFHREMKGKENKNKTGTCFEVIQIPLATINAAAGQVLHSHVPLSPTGTKNQARHHNNDALLYHHQQKRMAVASGVAKQKIMMTKKMLMRNQVPPPPFFIIHGEHASTLQEYLIHKYGVLPHGPSTLILIDSGNGQVINFQGKERMAEDPKGTHFPWNYPKLSKILLSGHFITARNNSSSCPSLGEVPSVDAAKTTKTITPNNNANGGIITEGQKDEGNSTNVDQNCQNQYETVNSTQVVGSGSVKGFFFAAHWCPPCRGFLQVLKQTYTKIAQDYGSHRFQIIFVSSDRSRESFNKVVGQLEPIPWLAVPFEDKQRREELTLLFNIKSIPALVIVDHDDDTVITLNGREEVSDDSDGLDFPWYPKRVEELRDRHSSVLNYAPCLIYFAPVSTSSEVDDDDEYFDKIEEALTTLAMEYSSRRQRVGAEALDANFFIGADSELSESLRVFMDLDEAASYLVAVHKGRYSVLKYNHEPSQLCETEKKEEIWDFIHKFQNSSPSLKYKYFSTKFI